MPHGSYGGVRDECRRTHECAGLRDGPGEESLVLHRMLDWTVGEEGSVGISFLRS